MKRLSPLLLLAAPALVCAPLLSAQNLTPSQNAPGAASSAAPPSAAQTAPQQEAPKSGVATTGTSAGGSAANTASGPDGVALINGEAYIIRGGQGMRLNAVGIQPGMMLNRDGTSVPMPKGLTGLSSSGGQAATSGTPGISPESGTAAGSNTSHSGVIIDDGAPHIVNNGRATRVDTTSVPAGSMMTFEGEVVPVPPGISGLDQNEEGTQPAKGTAANATAGSGSSARGTAGSSTGPSGSGAGTSGSAIPGSSAGEAAAGAAGSSSPINPGSTSPSGGGARRQ